MKRLLIIVACILVFNYTIIADELIDSITYYAKQIAAAEQVSDQVAKREGYKNLLRVYKELADDVSQDTIYAGIATQYGLLCGEAEEFSTAIEVTTEALAILKNVVGENNPLYASIQGDVAYYYSGMENYEKAIQYASIAVKTTKETSGVEDPNYVLLVNDLAAYYSYNGNYEVAAQVCKEVVDIYRNNRGDGDVDYIFALRELAFYYYQSGHPDKTALYAGEAIELLKKNQSLDYDEIVIILSYLIRSHFLLGNYAETIYFGSVINQVAKSTDLSNYPDYALALSVVANAYCYLRNYEVALPLATQAVDILKNTIGTENSDYATALNILSICHDKLGEVNSAIQFATEAMEIRKRVLGQDHHDYAISLINLASYYSELGIYHVSIKLGTEAVENLKKSRSTNDIDYAKSLFHLAGTYSELKNYDESIQLYLEASEIIKQTFGSENPDYAMILLELIKTYVLQKDFLKDSNRAKPLIKDYLQITKKNVLNAFSGLTAAERHVYWTDYSEKLNSVLPIIIFLSQTPDATSLLYDYIALFSKGLLLSTEIEVSKLIQDSGDQEALKMFNELKQNRQILNKQYSKPIAQRQIDCDSLERTNSSLERQLMNRVKEFGDYSKNLSITWQDVQTQLDDSDIAIEFFSFLGGGASKTYAALTLCKNDTAPVFTPLFLETSLLKASGDDNTYHTVKVDSLVWGPLSCRLHGKSNVYFSASGMLHNIGIEYLPSMEEKDCYRLSSTRELVTHQPSTSIANAMLYGDIDYDATYASIETSTPVPIREYAMNIASSQNRGLFDYRSMKYGVTSLPGTRIELEDVSVLMKEHRTSYEALTGVQASEESFKALSGKRKSLLHISTHGFYYNSQNLNKLSGHLRNTLVGNDRPENLEDQSLLRCGLCLAGANQALTGKSQPSEGQGDGILNALEIAQTDLRGLDLVVLSACQTALGDVTQGEGVFGLQRGFKKAGAKSILMTLWNVEDLTTQLLMVEFYRNYLSGKSKHESLRKAQQYVRDYTDEKGNKLFDDPHYWAGFILLDALD